MTRSRVSVFLSLLFCTASLFAAGGSIVVDSDGRALVAVNLADGTTTQKLQLTDTPYRVIASADGKRIVVFNRGAGDKNLWSGKFKPTGKSSVMIVDSAALKEVGHFDLGWDVGDAVFGNDGMLYVLTPGFTGRPEEKLPAELIKVDLQQAAIAKRIQFDRAPQGLAFTADGKAVVVYFAGDQKRKTAAEFRFVDLATLAPDAPLPMTPDTTAPVGFPGDPYLYAIGRGNDKDPGKVFVLSTADRSMKTIDVGEHARVGLADADTRRVYVLSASKNTDGLLHVIHGAALEKT